MADTFDYVVVGGGAAGCVVAARLSEDPAVSVLLLEAGKRDDYMYIHMPVGFYKMTSGDWVWPYKTAPQVHADNREIPYAQGHVLGGGSSVNAMVLTRGQPQDYDRWAGKEGAKGWTWDEVRPYFLRAEDNERFSNAYHGVGGPIGVSDPVNPTALSKAFVRACQEMGMPYNPDFNGPVQEGCGLYQTNTRRGRRSSTVDYLAQAKGRTNLTVRTRCLATKILVENGRAAGVEYVKGGSKSPVLARAGREVVVSAGAIGSPKLLLLSGVGPADELTRLGIPTVHRLEGVGRNLQDHFDVDVIYDLKGPFSLDRYKKPHWMIWAGIEYYLFHHGPVTSNVVEGGAFWHSRPDAATPDLQFHFLVGAGVEAGIAPVPSGNGCTMNSYHTRPRSRGRMTLRSSDPADLPNIDVNYWADPDDRKASIEGLRVSREIMTQPSFKPFVRREHLPGPDVQSQTDLEAYARHYGRTSYHPVGTCKMGGDDLAVVDPQLRVRGLEGLRVIDSSVFPSLTSSNTFMPTVMIAEKGSDMVRGRAPLRAPSGKASKST
jgi:choline dehydrogenase